MKLEIQFTRKKREDGDDEEEEKEEMDGSTTKKDNSDYFPFIFLNDEEQLRCKQFFLLLYCNIWVISNTICIRRRESNRE